MASFKLDGGEITCPLIRVTVEFTFPKEPWVRGANFWRKVSFACHFLPLIKIRGHRGFLCFTIYIFTCDSPNAHAVEIMAGSK